MKLITAIIKPFKTDDVKEALKAAGVTGMTVTEVQGFGRQCGHTEVYRGAEYRPSSCRRCASRSCATTPRCRRITEVIVGTAVTDKIGDGKIWVIDVETVMRLRTGERDTDAI